VTRSKKLDYPNTETPRNSKKYVKAMKRLDVSGTTFDCSKTIANKDKQCIPPNNDFNRQFLDLLRRIFVYDPSKRITAIEALKHPWFKETSNDDGTEAARIREERLARDVLAQKNGY